MNKESSKTPNHNSSKKMRRTRSVSQPSASDFSARPDIQDAALLAQFAASQGQQNPRDSIESLVQAVRAAQEQIGHLHAPQLSPSSFPWEQMHHQYPYPSLYGPQPVYVPETMNFPYSIHPIPPSSIDTDDNTISREQSLSPSAPSPSGNSSSPDGPEQSEAERISSSEDKRRRNTAASGKSRFRIKKKQRILNLERSLCDLKGRAKDLEGEAAELRRENGWLKEIVMLKGAAATRALLPLQTQTAVRSLQRPDEDASKDSYDKAEAENLNVQGTEYT